MKSERWYDDVGRGVEIDLGEPDYSKLIKDDDVMRGLKAISDRYDSEVRAQARAYAEESLRTEFETDEELTAKVKESLEDKYEGKRDVLDTKYEREHTGYATNREKALESKRSEGERLAAAYEKAQGRYVDKMARQGISHSTIASLGEEKLGANYRAAREESDRYYDLRVQSYDEKIERLNASYEAALKNYEITYAIELERKLDDLKTKRDKLVEKYEKSYDAEYRKAYRAYLEQEETDSLFYEKETGDYAGAKKENYEERYNYLVGELKGKNKARLTTFLSAHEGELKKYLGLYYEKFLKEVS